MQPIDPSTAFSMDFFSLKGKTAIVTGGNSGLGQAFAVALATAGANLFVPAPVSYTHLTLPTTPYV